MSTSEDTNQTAHLLSEKFQSAESTGVEGMITVDVNPTDNSHNSSAGNLSFNGCMQTMNPISSTVDSGPVQAYAKLESDTFCYYIRTLQVMLGRRAGSTDPVDIHLGSTKGISRQHARLFYNFLNQRFELIVYGKNGAFVNEQFIEKGSTVPLEHRTKVQIGETTFHFLLPKMELEEATHENYSCLSGADDFHQEMKQPQSLQGQPIPFVSQPQAHMQLERSMQMTHPHQQPDTRHFTATSAGERHISNSTEFEQADGTQGTAREGEMFDTSEYNNKDVKPPFSYASLIAQAINTTPNKKLTLNGIYNYITSHYPYYQMAQNGWQNSIRHNLSLNKAFLKVPRGDNEPGKGAFWTIDASCEGQFRNGVYRKSRRQPNTKSGGITGPVQPKTGATSASPYNPSDSNRRRSTSSKSAVPAVGTVHASSSVFGIVAVQSDAPTGVKIPTAGTTPLVGGEKFSHNLPNPSDAVPNASTAAALVVPQASSSYFSTSPYSNSNISQHTSNAQTDSTTISPASQLLTAAATLSSPPLAFATQNMTRLPYFSQPQLSTTPVAALTPLSVEGLTMAGTSDSTGSGLWPSPSVSSIDMETTSTGRSTAP